MKSLDSSEKLKLCSMGSTQHLYSCVQIHFPQEESPFENSILLSIKLLIVVTARFSSYEFSDRRE